MLVVVVVTAGLTYWLPPGGWRFLAACALLWILPGVAWGRCVAGDVSARATLGLGLAFVITGLTTLVLYFIPGPFPTDAARFVYALLAGLPLLWRRAATACAEEGAAVQREADAPPGPALPFWLLCLLAALTLLGRLPHLGYSEFQGDEAVILQRAAQALSGDDVELFLHQKGPVEILTPMALWALSDTLSEWQARTPFALGSVLGVLAVALLATRWFDARVGGVAGGLLAVNGLLVAFGRIVQYQSLVVAMSALGLLMLTEYGRTGRLRALLLSAGFIAYGLLAHYDAVLIAPAALYLLVVAFVSRRADWRQSLRHLGIACLVGLGVVGMFYVPFLLNPMFARTFVYLSAGRLGGDGFFHNSLSSVWRFSVFYTSLYYVVGLGIGVAVAAVMSLWRVRRASCGTAWLYFLAPFGFYAFVVVDPRTHIYTFFPGAAILAGMAAVACWDSVYRKSHILAGVGGGLGGVWYILIAGYVVLAFVGHYPEYKREWPESQHALYPVPIELPLYGYFGFPYRAGWKAVEGLYAQGRLQGTYASNEEPEITTWYVRSGRRTMCGQPDYYIIAVNVQDEIPVDWEALARDYTAAVEVTVLGRPKLVVYQRKSPDIAPYTVADADFAPAFDATATVTEQLLDTYNGTHPVGADFGTVGRLLGYDVSMSQGLDVTLYWQALSSPQRNYQVFVHVMADGQLVAQHDGAPACASAPTSHWEQGEIVRDEHYVAVSPDVLPENAQVYVGLYDLITLERLPVAHSADNVLLFETAYVSSDFSE